MPGSCKLANSLGSGGMSRVEKSLTVTNARESGEPEQSRVGGNLICFFFSPHQIVDFAPVPYRSEKRILSIS